MSGTFVEERAQREHWEGERARYQCLIVRERARKMELENRRLEIAVERHHTLLQISRDRLLPWPVRAIARFFWRWS